MYVEWKRTPFYFFHLEDRHKTQVVFMIRKT